MEKSDWIMSEGGPLICMERRLQSSWGGIEGLTVAAPDASSDYDRACLVTNYLESVRLSEGLSLIIGDAPLDTAFWRSEAGAVFLVRIWYCEEDFDIDVVMRALDLRMFERPEETLQFSFATPDLVMFDSAEPGYNNQKRLIPFSIKSGGYRISTSPYEPDPLTSLLVHRFEPVT